MVESGLFKRERLNRVIPTIDFLVNSISSVEHRADRKRLIGKEGDVNFRRINLSDRSRYLKDIFTSLLDLSWIWILFLFVLSFVISWLFFACIWYLIMEVHGDFSTNQLNVSSIPCVAGVKSFVGTVLFSIETQQTIGYGTRSVTEECLSGLFILIFQSCIGLIIQALWVGLVYTKLSRPKKRRRTLLWSRECVISLRDGYLTLQCRLGDMRYKSTLAEAHIRMYFLSQRHTFENEIIPVNLLDMDVGYDGGKDRLFFNWPIIIEHQINDRSPLYQMDKDNISKEIFEILVVLEGTIEPTGMTTQVRTSYMPQEIRWGQRFQTMIHFNDQHYTVDYDKFNSTYDDNCTPNCSAKQLFEQQNPTNN